MLVKTSQRSALRALLAGFAVFAVIGSAGVVQAETNTSDAPAAKQSTVKSTGKTAEETGNRLLQRIKRVRPDIPILAVSSSPVPGILEMELEGGTTLYGTEDGKFMFSGDLYSIGDIELVNLAEAKREVARKELLATIDAKDAFVFKAAGPTKAVVNVFTDVDCGYCRKLHAEVPRLNELGIEVRYLAYPRAGIGSDSYNTIVSAWCADDRDVALTNAKSGKPIAAKTCVNPVAEQFEIGHQAGVTGTPAIVTDSGKLLPGYMPADILAQTLGVPAS